MIIELRPDKLANVWSFCMFIRMVNCLSLRQAQVAFTMDSIYYDKGNHFY